MGNKIIDHKEKKSNLWVQKVCVLTVTQGDEAMKVIYEKY